MKTFLFWLLVLILGGVFTWTGAITHYRELKDFKFGNPFHVTAGWWTGIILAIILLFASSSYFEGLPTHYYTYEADCDTHVGSYTDWEEVESEAIKLDWIALGIGLMLGFLAFEILDVISASSRVMAFVMMLVSASSLYFLAYVFLIRKLTYLIFSLVLGNCLAYLLRKAFR